MRATIGGMIRTVVKEGAAKRYRRVRPAVKTGKPARHGARSKS